MGYSDWPKTLYVWRGSEEDDEEEEFYISSERSMLPDEDGKEIAGFQLDKVYRLAVEKKLSTV